MVRSKAFVVSSTAPPAGTTTVVYTTPAGRTAVVRHYTLMNESGVQLRAYMGIRRSSTVAWVAFRNPLEPGAVLGVDLKALILEPGDDLVVNVLNLSGSSTQVSIYAAGSLLLGVAA